MKKGKIYHFIEYRLPHLLSLKCFIDVSGAMLGQFLIKCRRLLKIDLCKTDDTEKGGNRCILRKYL